MQQAEDFRAECRALLGLVSDVSDEGFGAPTQFKGWALNDVFQHLHFWNRMARWQVEDPDALVAELGLSA